MPVYQVSVQFDENSLMNTVGGIQCYAALKNIGSILRTQPEFEQLYEDTFFPTVNYYIATNQNTDALKKYVSIPDVTLSSTITNIQQLQSAGTGQAPAAAPPPPPKPAVQAAAAPVASAAPVVPAAAPAAPSAPVAAAKDTGAGAQKPASAASSEDAKKAGKEAGSILRVDSKRIDDLLNLVSETVITKATFNQINIQFTEMITQLRGLQTNYRDMIKNLFENMPKYLESIQEGQSIKDIRKEMGEQYGDIFSLFDVFETNLKGNISKFRSTSQNLGRITGELQEGVMRIRMVPISQIFSRFPRLVRDLSKSLNKKINLVIEGEETELDKSVIDDLLDPIMHSVRNSVDHGIESAEERMAAGKAEE